jgi:hypothetical protein
MLKNLFKATRRFCPYSHKCLFSLQFNLYKGLLTKSERANVLLEKLFQHVCLSNIGFTFNEKTESRLICVL